MAQHLTKLQNIHSNVGKCGNSLPPLPRCHGGRIEVDHPGAALLLMSIIIAVVVVDVDVDVDVVDW